MLDSSDKDQQRNEWVYERQRGPKNVSPNRPAAMNQKAIRPYVACVIESCPDEANRVDRKHERKDRGVAIYAQCSLIVKARRS